jgi:hypothetical protein
VRRADHSSREVLPTVMRLSVIVKPRQEIGLGPLSGHVKRKSSLIMAWIQCAKTGCVDADIDLCR